MYSLCHNCSNESFKFPQYNLQVTIQDCWRAKDRPDEQNVVRQLLKKMNIDFVEAAENHEHTEFCGNSLYRPQPPCNPKLAPKHYVEAAKGKFVPHTLEAQKQIMQDYCKQFKTDTVVCYCHYCLEGLLLGGVNGKHIAQLLF